METTAEDIKFLGRFQGAPGLIWIRATEAISAIFAFYSPLKILAYRRKIVKGYALPTIGIAICCDNRPAKLAELQASGDILSAFTSGDRVRVSNDFFWAKGAQEQSQARLMRSQA